MTTQLTDPGPTDLAVAAATLRPPTVLPSVHPLTVAGAPGRRRPVGAGFAGAVVADVANRPRRSASPCWSAPTWSRHSPPARSAGLDLAAAVQPALDAAAAALGGRPTPRAGSTRRRWSTPTWAAPSPSSRSSAPALPPPSPLTAMSSGRLQTCRRGLHRHRLRRRERAGRRPGRGAHQPLASSPQPGIAPRRGIEMLHGVDMEVTVELGRTRMTVRDLLALAPGDVLELDRAAGSPADLLVNGRLIARGEVVVVDEDFGLRITEIVDESAAG